MKKLLLILSVLFVSSSVLSAADTMKMVTYFPVPYVAYSQVKVKEQLDIGTASNACRLDLGCANSRLSLKVEDGINLVKGMLAFADKETTPSVTLTTTETIIGKGAGESSFTFSNNLTTKNIKDALSFQVTAFNPDTFYLFPGYHTGNAFPSCSAGISWERVRLKNVDEVYLVCGDAPSTSGGTTSSSSKTYKWKYTRTESTGGGPAPCQDPEQGTCGTCTSSNEGATCYEGDVRGPYCPAQEGCDREPETCDYSRVYYTCTAE